MNFRSTFLWRIMSLQGLFTSVYLTLTVLSIILIESEGTRSSFKDLQSMNNVNEESSVSNDSKILKIEPDVGPASSQTYSRNSPALNSFLKNVLQAQDELKWIDQAVRGVDTKDTQEKVPSRYLRSSFRNPTSFYNANIRFKRESDPQLFDQDFWTSPKRRYIYDDHNSNRVYLDNEMKVKRQAKYPYNKFYDQRYRPSRKTHSRRSSVDNERQPVDDLTLKNWAKKEGLQVPNDWFDSRQLNGGKFDEFNDNHWSKSDYVDDEGLNQMDDFSRNVDNWVDNSRDERDAIGHSLERKEVKHPTLDSLKKSVLELKKSIEESDKKMNALNEKGDNFDVVKNRERHTKDISRSKEDITNKKFDFNSRYDPGSNFYEEIDREDQDDPSSSKMEISGGSNWWKDPRSAIDMFEFKKRDDDMEDEDDDEESAPGNSEFDYIMPRVKREKDHEEEEEEEAEEDEGEKKVRVYRRAGFGESFHKEEKKPKENGEGISKVGRVHREIREAKSVLDKINDEGNTDGVKTEENKRVLDTNTVNENENESGHYLGEFSTEIKNFGKDNPAEKSPVLKSEENMLGEKVTGTFGDRNLEDEKKPGFLSADEKRSSSLRGTEDEHEQRFSTDISSEKNIKKETISAGKNEKREVEKSEQTDDDVHKLSQDSNDDKKREDQKRKDEGEILDDKKSENNEDEIIKTDNVKLVLRDSGVKIIDDDRVKNKSEDEDNLKYRQLTNGSSAENINVDHENEIKVQSGQESEIVKLIEPEISKIEIKNTDLKDLEDNEDENNSEIRDYQEEKKREKDRAKENPEKLRNNNKYKQEENYQLIVYNDKDNEKYHLDGKNFDTKIKDGILKREDLSRKLLWLSDKSKEELKVVEIRDGRRDSAWDQNHGEKSGQRPANILKNSQALKGIENNDDQYKFVKRSLMVADDNIVEKKSVNPEINHRLKKRNGIKSIKNDTAYDRSEDSNFQFIERSKRLEKRSVDKSYPENFLQLKTRKRSLKNIIERQSDPDILENVSEIENDSVSEDDEDFKNSALKNEGEKNRAVESEAGLSNRDRDRDPMRDRINMLIKEKLDDRGKGKLTHTKREIDNQAENIEYYDYDSDVNGVDSEIDSKVVENNCQMLDNNNSSNSQDKASETMTKKDENQEEERKEELEQEERKHKAPKEEFISDVMLGKTQKKIPPPSSKINAELSSDEKSYPGFNEDDIKKNLQESNTHTYTHWLGQPAEADPDQENDSIDRQDRYQDIREFEGQKKSLENENTEVLEEPLEYSVNVHGKLDPDSIDAMLNDKENPKDKELENDEKRNDKLQIGSDEDDKSRSRNEQLIDDDEFEGYQQVEDKSSARIEEGINDRDSIRNIKNYDHSIEDTLSREDRLTEDSDQGIPSDEISGSVIDSLPTMLDRSETKNLAPEEKTYLVIAPARVQCPQESSNDYNSSSSGSNYLALKITDDMFKGGIEQSNPTDDKITDNNFMGKTTTEWKVIKMAENAKDKPHLKSNNLLLDKREKVDTNSQYDKSNGLKNFAINSRDVLHESIVDPEEMDGDFDDDMRPRFGRDLKFVRKSHRHFTRSLQSVSYPIDPFELVDRNANIDNGEKPVDKYLENSQSGFKKSGITDHRIKKRKVTDDNLSLINKDKLNEDQNISDIKTEQKNLTRMAENFEKRSFGLETPSVSGGDNDTKIDKDKRGLTNVEEWEINAPTVQKQRLISTSQKSGDFREKYNLDDKIIEKKNVELETASKISLPNFSENSVTSGSHEREIRSVNLRDENFEFDPFPGSHKSLSANRRRSKIHGKNKLYDRFRASKLSASRSKPFAKYASSFNSNPHYDYDERNSKNDENFGVSDDHDWKKLLSPGENVEEKNRRLKSNDYWSLDHGRYKSALENHNNKEIPGHGNRESLLDSTNSKTQLKNTKGHGERNFKEMEGSSVMQNAKAHNKMTPNAIGRLHTTPQSKSFQGAEGHDIESPIERDKKVLDENAEDPVTPIPKVDETQKKKFTVLLAADNMEDESQMDLALHGELAGKIVEQIFDQVQKNDALKLALGPGLYRKHKSEDAIATDKIYHQGLDEDEVKHTEGMMRRVMELLGRLILDEVQRKTCASLPPDMKEFLQWMLGVEDDEKPTDQVPPLPFVHNQEPNQQKDEKFLFENPSMRNENADLNELNKKVRLLRSLINEYNSLTDREKTKVQTVHDYLVRQLDLLIKYIDAKQSEGGKNLQTGGIGNGNILQYQNAVPNTNGTVVSKSTLSPLVNTPSSLMLSNASFVEQPSLVSNHLVRSRFRETRSSKEKTGKKPKRKHKKHKHKKNKNKNKKKKKKKHKKEKRAQSPEYKKLIRRAAMLRKKRANLYEDNWDPIDSGYEEPTIYTSNGEVTNKLKRSISKKSPDSDEESPRYWADVLSGKSDGEIIADKGSPDSQKFLNFDSKIPEGLNTPVTKIADSMPHEKRDVFSASIALQPWLNPKSNDLVSSNYLKELTNELVHGSLVPPVYPLVKVDEKEKREAGMTEGRNIADDEVMLLSKREAWKTENEKQLEEVAFGKDMRDKWDEKEQFEKLTGINKKKNTDDGINRMKREGEGINFDKESYDTTAKNIDDEIASGEDNTVKNNYEIRYKNDTKNAFSEVKVGEDTSPVKKEVNENRLIDVMPDSTNLGNSKTLSVPKIDVQEFEKSIEGSEKSEKNEEQSKLQDKNFQDSNVSDKTKKDNFFELIKIGTDKRSEMIKSGENSLHEPDTKKFEKLNEKRSSPLLIPEAGESAILPLLKISEQIQEQKQASKTEKDDQRDIADQMLGFESPFIAGLINTY